MPGLPLRIYMDPSLERKAPQGSWKHLKDSLQRPLKFLHRSQNPFKEHSSSWAPGSRQRLLKILKYFLDFIQGSLQVQKTRRGFPFRDPWNSLSIAWKPYKDSWISFEEYKTSSRTLKTSKRSQDPCKKPPVIHSIMPGTVSAGNAGISAISWVVAGVF